MAFSTFTSFLPFYTGAIPLYQRLSTQDPVTAGTGPIFLDNINCNLTVNRLIDCPRGGNLRVNQTNNCNHNKDVGVRCEPIGFRGEPCTFLSVNTHLVNALLIWVLARGGPHSYVTLPIFFDVRMWCLLHTSPSQEAKHAHKKLHIESCLLFSMLDVCQTGQLRLVGGANPRQGRVEICYYNQWGTVCDDAFGALEARVICGIIGYSNTSMTCLMSV
jgi:hypothetical protein